MPTTLRESLPVRAGALACVARCTAAASVVAILGAGRAVAQEPVPEADEPLQEVIVTAQYREQSIQDTPLSVNAFSGDELAAQRILAPKDLSRMTPGLFISESTANQTDPEITLRGVGTNDRNSNQNPAVSLYIDGVAVPFNGMASHTLFDVQRVEVLKGPQGTLYGRNTTGGAVNFIPRRPGSEFGGYTNLSYGSRNRRDVEAALDVPLGDTFAVRVAGTSQLQDGWQTIDLRDYFPEGLPTFANNGLVRRNGDVDRKAARISAAWRPSESFDMLTTVDAGWDNSQVIGLEHAGNVLRSNPSQFCSFATQGIRDENQCASIAFDSRTAVLIPVSLAGLDFTVQDPSNRGNLVIVSDPNTGPRTIIKNFSRGSDIDAEALGVTNTANWNLERMTLTSVSGYRTFDRDTGIGQQGGPFRTIGGLTKNDIEIMTQEIRLASDDSWERMHWVAGAFYTQEDVYDFLLPDLSENHTFSAIFLSEFWQDTEAVAGFGQVEYDLTGTLQVVGGLRYTSESRDFRYAGDQRGNGPPIVRSFAQKVSSDQLTWRAGLNYRPTDDWLVYGSVATGFRGKGFPASISFSTNQLQPFAEETITAYEAGFKSTLLTGHLRFNAAAYFYDWSDFQAATAVDRNGVRLIVLTNAGDAEVKGVETDIAWFPTDELSLRLGANFMDAKIVAGALTGNTLSRSPDLTASGTVRYDSRRGAGTLRPFAQLGYTYTDDVLFQIPNHPGSAQEGYWLLSAQLGVKLPDDRLEISLWAENLGDQLYRTESFGPASMFLPGGLLYGPPRTVGASLNFSF